MEEDDTTVMNPELGLKIQIEGTEFGSDYPSRSESVGSDRMDKGYVPRFRPSDAFGFAVSTRSRSKRLKSISGARIRCFSGVRGDWGICSKGDEAVVSSGEVGEHGGDPVYTGGNEGNLGDSGCVDGEMVEIEVEEEPMVETAAVARSNGIRRFSRSIIKSKDKKLESEFPGGLQDAISLEVEVVLESEESNSTKMESSKEIGMKGRPKTVKELFETGLLEGYPVFYNGGKRRFPLRGSIKDSGILCLCSSCKGLRVVPPCQFEIHARKSYRRASQYICLENGKSLLDVVKECRKSSVKTLEETIHKFVGPMPVKESVICMNCQGPYLATASEVELVCDSCIIIENSEIDAECGKSRHLELASNTKSPLRSPLQISSRRSQQKIMKISSRQQPVSKSALASYSKSSSDLRANGSNSMQGSTRNIDTRKILKKYHKMHRMVFEDGGLPDGTEVAYYSNGKKLRDGYKMGWGIMCRCCRTLVSPSQFEAHAGRASHRKPYMCIYTSNGISLHEFAITMLKGHKLSADGVKLVLCDGCPRAFHEECASLSSTPHAKWYCTYCQDKFQKERFVEHDSNAVVGGRVLGIDPIEQITNRCIHNIKNPEEAELIAGYNLRKSGFGPRTVILCDSEKRNIR